MVLDSLRAASTERTGHGPDLHDVIGHETMAALHEVECALGLSDARLSDEQDPQAVDLEQTTVPFISTTNLANMEIPIPPLDRQRVFIDFEKTSRKYGQFSRRKRELQREILNYELTHNETF